MARPWGDADRARVLTLRRKGARAEDIAAAVHADVKNVRKLLVKRFGTSTGATRRGHVITGYEAWPIKPCRCGNPLRCPYPECLEDA